jgi:EAL domain-containing protein (putative c-di-GMP-specific phosphodiesterase class I)
VAEAAHVATRRFFVDGVTDALFETLYHALLVYQMTKKPSKSGFSHPDGPPPMPTSRPEPTSPPPKLAVGTSRDVAYRARRRATTEPGTPAAAEEGQRFASDLAELESSFERAMASLRMAYQPIVTADRQLFGYEALLRSGEPSLPHPGAVLDAAERLNRLTRLGRAVRSSVARTFSETDDSQGLLFVNLHALDLTDATLSSPYAPLARIARRVVLEVTERASVESIPDLRFRVAELREMGYRIAIDDLGAGHSRMHQFTPLDTDFVKLDMALVRDIDAHPVKQQLVRSITQLCHGSGIQVIGEGVETEAEARSLVELDCDLLQGYLIARPGPPFPSLG